MTVASSSGLTAPFPWFGGKSRAAAEVWDALGDVDAYCEPFAGSLGALLGRPHPAKTETVNDADGLLINMWRAMRADPGAVADAADWPVSEIDLTARHLWLVENRARIYAALLADPEWFDARAAGWWIWGACCWIGSGWCSGNGPWRIEDGDLRKVGDAGRGIHRKLPHLGNAGRGIHRQLPHLGNAGRGIHRQLPHLGDAGRGGPVGEWFDRLSVRLRRVRITAGDWSRVVTGSTAGDRIGTCGVYLDPPYPEGWDTGAAYAGQSAEGAEVCRDVWTWAVEDGVPRGLRIVISGYEGTWTPPAGWTTRRWVARKGYAGADNKAHHREVLWCSPACLPPRSAGLFGGGL